MDVQIFLDCSASMGKENRTKAEYAVSVAAALGFCPCTIWTRYPSS